MRNSDSIGARLEHYLLIQKYAIPAWLLYMAVTAVVMIWTILSGPVIATIPGTESAVVPGLMLLWGMIWMLAGASVGWVPPHFR